MDMPAGEVFIKMGIADNYRRDDRTLQEHFAPVLGMYGEASSAPEVAIER